MPTTVSTTSELISAVENADPGSEIVARGGTYNMSGRWNIENAGSEGNRIVIRGAEGETPHIKFEAGRENPTDDSGIKVNVPYVTVKGFEISDSGFKGIFAGSNGHDVTFEDLDVHHCNVWGIMNNGNDNVVFRNCDSHDNYDPQNDGQHSDGINMTGPASNGLIEGCRAWNNGDDGYDMWVSEDHTIRNCWAWNNGIGSEGNGNGFKLGSSNSGQGGGHLVTNCIAFGNRSSGFWWNGVDNPIKLYNCTAWKNAVNYAFHDAQHVLKNNISFEGKTSNLSDAQADGEVDQKCDPNDPNCGVSVGSQVIQEANTWNLEIGDPEFRSLDSSSEDFLRLTETSPCRDSGVDVGLSYSGDAPDLGAFQFDGQSAESGTTDSRLEVDGEATLAAADAEMTKSLLQDEHSGFNGSGYINFIADSGANAYWPLEVATAGQYSFKIYYANGGSTDRTVNMAYGGEQREITFPQTGGWSNWSTVTGTIDLPDGAVDLIIATTGQDAGNIDQITIWPAEEDTSGDSSTESTSDTPNHGYNVPEAGQKDWHVPLNENFEAIDRDVPVVDLEGAKDEYDPAERTLYIALDTGTVYVGTGSEWDQLGTLS